MPTEGKIYNRAGTIINPPPIPRRPAKKPTTDPSKRHIKKTCSKLSTMTSLRATLGNIIKNHNSELSSRLNQTTNPY